MCDKELCGVILVCDEFLHANFQTAGAWSQCQVFNMPLVLQCKYLLWAYGRPRVKRLGVHLCIYNFIFVRRQKTRLFTSYCCLKIGSKTLPAACSLNLLFCKTFSVLNVLARTLHGTVGFIVQPPEQAHSAVPSVWDSSQCALN